MREIRYNVTGKKRSELVRAIESITGSKKKYLGAPTFAYTIGDIEVSRNGTVSFDENFEKAEDLVEKLSEYGFDRETTLTIEMPKEKLNIPNLRNLLEAKGELIRKALEVDELPVIEKDETVSFPWFHDTDPESVKACTHFISAICEMSLKTRISSKAKAVDNEKYAFRCFLIRLGFIGDEYKDERKILLRNLEGSSAFRNGGVRDEISGQR